MTLSGKPNLKVVFAFGSIRYGRVLEATGVIEEKNN